MRRLLAHLCAPLLVVGVSACASTTSSSSFKGESHAVAQTIANLQSDTTAGEAKKICTDLLSSAVTTRLSAARGGCTQAVKSQLSEVDTPELKIQSIQLRGASASAQVQSTYAGKKRIGMLTLVKEGGAWKISALQ